MIIKFFITMVMLLLFNCNKEESGPTAPQQPAAPKEEITAAVERIFQNLEKMDAESLFVSYHNSSDFMLFTTNGSMLNYQAAKAENTAWFSSLSQLEVTTIKNECKFLPGDIAICAWLGKFDVTSKTGVDSQGSFAITFIFSKVNNQWKVIYQHTSALPS